MKVALPFVGGAYKGRSKNVNAQECINLFLEPDTKSARSQAVLVGAPGTSLWATIPTSPIRGMRTVGPLLYVVAGNKLYSVTSASPPVATERGTLNTSTGLVSMSDNGFNSVSGGQQVIILDGTDGYIWNIGTSTFSVIAAAGFSAGKTVTFMDGYFIKDVANSGRFQISALYDGTSWDALDFATAESSPDDLQAVIADNQELWLVGTTSTEIWYNSGDADFPFERYQGGFVNMGTPAPRTVAEIDNTLMWLSQDDRGQSQVIRAFGPGEAPIVSTPSINYSIQQYSTVSDAFAFVYQAEGHEFYVLTFPTANVTWVYDALTNEWHKRANTISSNTAARLRFSCHAYFAGKHLVGDYANGKIYEYSTAYNQYDGDEAMVRVRDTQHTNDTDRRISIHKFETILEGGNGGTCTLAWSKDNGQTFGTAQSRTMGNASNARVFWTRLGRARDWVFRWICSSNVKVVVLGANAHGDGDNDGADS